MWIFYLMLKQSLFGPDYDNIHYIHGLTWRRYFYVRIYRAIRVKFWRIKTKIWYPIRYYFSNKFKKSELLAIPNEQLEPFMIKSNDLDESGKFIEDKVNVFPMEIWYEISKYMNRGKLIRINKTFCDFFSPFIYNDLQLMMTVSGTLRLQRNDDTYVNFGPDFYNHKVDDYAIYTRYREGLDQEYEVLDITLREESNSERDFNDYDVIYKYKEVVHILRHVINNPVSRMKKYIKKIKLDVALISQGAGSARTEHEDLMKTLERFQGSDNLSILSHKPSYSLYSVFLLEMYLLCRWQRPYFVPYNPAFEDPELIHPDVAKSIYPHQANFREMFCVSLIHKMVRDKEKRKKLSEISTDKELELSAPYVEWHTKTQRFITPGEFPEDRRLIQLTAQLQSEVIIENRMFIKKDVVDSLLKETTQSLSSSARGNETIDCSMSFILESIALNGTNFRVNAGLSRFRPKYYVFNKPRHG